MIQSEVLTIGYAGHDLETFVWVLEKEGTEVLVDVRDSPRSRNPAYCQGPLRSALADAGVEYVHFGQLGVPAQVRKELDPDADFGTYARAYRRHLASAGGALEELHGLATEKRCCLMCLEKNAQRCHRSILAQRLSGMNGRRLAVRNL